MIVNQAGARSSTTRIEVQEGVIKAIGAAAKRTGARLTAARSKLHPSMTARHFRRLIQPRPAHGVRLGAAKLLLPLFGRPLILHTLAAWQQSKVDRIVVVVRPGDDSLAACRSALPASRSSSQRRRRRI